MRKMSRPWSLTLWTTPEDARSSPALRHHYVSCPAALACRFDFGRDTSPGSGGR